MNKLIYNTKTKNYTIKEEIVSDDDILMVENLKKDIEVSKKKERLNQLTEDIIQHIAGEDVPDIKERMYEFINIHNEIREYEGKPPREINLL